MQVIPRYAMCFSFLCRFVLSFLTCLQDGDYKMGTHEIPSENIICVEQVDESLLKLNQQKGRGPDCLPTWVLRDFGLFLAANLYHLRCQHQRINPPCSVEVCYCRAHSQNQHSKKFWEGLVADLTDTSPVQRAGTRGVPVDYEGCERLARPLPVWCNLWIVDSTRTSGPYVWVGWKKIQTPDTSNTVIRAVLLDYGKTFDLIDHHILIEKLYKLALPDFIISWAAGFLHGRKH